MKGEVTFHRFYSEIRSYINNLLKTSTKDEPNKYLKDLGFTKERLIRLLMNEKILKRDEKIIMPDESNNNKKVKYSIKYTLNAKEFEDKIEGIHNKYFANKSDKLNEEMDMYSCSNIIGVTTGPSIVGRNTADKWVNYVNQNKDMKRSVFKDEDTMKKNIMKNEEDAKMYRERGGIKECDGGGCCDSSAGLVDGATNSSTSGQFTTPLFGVQRRDPMVGLKNKKGQEKLHDPAKFKVGKTIQEGCKHRQILFTEEQMKYILKDTDVDLDEATTSDVSGQYTVPFASDPETRERKPGFSVKRLK